MYDVYDKTYLSIQRLAEISKKGLTSTRKVVHELEQMGYIFKEKKNRMFVYTLNLA